MEQLLNERRICWKRLKKVLTDSETDVLRDALEATRREAGDCVRVLSNDLQRAIVLGHSQAGLDADIAYWQMRQATADRLLVELFAEKSVFDVEPESAVLAR
ncbi:hypothetical protein [Propionimicrobium lymphophilum]|uniref:Uncharacterized protein n=2 Tax=Propionimicrobium TaxID=203133 RepID=S2W122_9ACTN|nr:hypothetical protein [Propionimicrobium lymphophilum]EPD32070.1 hypothetical protein HMPREF9306_01632 [Propionimicrobium lymphophilum ACS-093-V-SCH5]